MAVQMATSSSDLAQICVPAKTATVSGDCDAAGAEFKNILQGMRESLQKTPRTAPKEPKTPVNFAFLAAEDGESAAYLDEPAAERPRELETTPDDGPKTPLPSRFNPDAFLDALEAAVADKRCADTDGDAETREPAREEDETDDTADLETAALDSGENEAQSAPVSGDGINVPVEINGKTATDVKNLAEHPAPTADAGIAEGETDESAIGGVLRGTNPGESQETGAGKLPSANENTENPDNAGRETSLLGDARGVEEKEAPKAVTRASDRIHDARGREAAESAEKLSPEKPSTERAAEPPVFAAAQFAEPGRARTEAPPVVQAPVVYTLMSADKFGEGLRSVLTVITREGGAEARIVVEPPALGRVDISLRSSANGVEANFRVDNEELRQMVQKQLDSLKESLTAQGIHVSGMTVDIKNNEGERDRGNAGASKKGRRQVHPGVTDEDIEDGARVLRLDLEKGLLHWVA
jgi:flagellar hook-length control protein FliK